MTGVKPRAARRFLVRGRVQGVFFRASTARQALALSLAGYAQNLPDGSVQVLAGGEPAALDALADWLRRGPPMARVDSVESEAIDPAGEDWPAGFRSR